ncbi:hypothetical protein [Burkholderia sp. S-53]|uniref:hypothetical protein n=1 Tax=Burkholderia sp. S-53 TaxID=2906514 RepID=UPI0021D0532C|nr:hypothetical protein [Burkholderia sp. S-53]UXU91440.1 hypothetical protein LXM88_25055 [Burkholderia sp. S-53]
MAVKLPYLVANAVSNILLHEKFANLSRKAVKVLEILVLAVDKRDPLGPILKRRERIGEQSRYGRTTICAALNELTDAGLVTRNEQRGIYGRVYAFLTEECALALGLINPADEGQSDTDKSQQTSVQQDEACSNSGNNWKVSQSQNTPMDNTTGIANASRRKREPKAPVIPNELRDMLMLEVEPGKRIYPETICKLMGEVRASVQAGILAEGTRLGDLWRQFGKNIRSVEYPVAYMRKLIQDPVYYPREDLSTVPFKFPWMAGRN